jgi:hypothetical protein
MYPSGYAETGELRERRYLVATLLYDAWLPRALERQLPDAERKAFYWSGIYGAPRTRISEVWVQARQQRRAPEPQFGAQPTITVTMAPEESRMSRLFGALGRFDASVDPAYAKAMADAFLVYVGSQVAMRVLENLKFVAGFA